MIETAKRLYTKYYEALAYLFFGGLATLLNLVLYLVFDFLFGYEAAASWGNVLNNILCIHFAYFTNRTWVFKSRTRGGEAIKEYGKFITCRLGTLVLDVAITFAGARLGLLFVSPKWLSLWGLGVKVVSNVFVVVGNYIFSKLIIFKNKQG